MANFAEVARSNESMDTVKAFPVPLRQNRKQSPEVCRNIDAFPTGDRDNSISFLIAGASAQSSNGVLEVESQQFQLTAAL
jgi:hypothetical protein